MSKVILVEDDPDLRYISGIMLRREGFDVREFEAGPAAIAACRAQRPDVVLLDWMLPEMSGLEILRDLRAHPDTADVPVVMVTALGTPDHIAAAKRAGANDYVTKPFTRAKLADVVTRQVPRTPMPSFRAISA